ncbi:MAG: respiratory nitrate reductase subunit gamma [Crocinitomicaceae bacterium]|nr:respiratory nitrate reductase subunit gamma [Crocinitomicaceae bacterium]
MAYQLNIEKMQTKSKNKQPMFGRKSLLTALTVVIAMFSFNSSAQSGEELFTTKCATCHSITDKRMVGPGLGGLNDRREEEWSIKWIQNSQELIDSGDEDAIAIFEEYNNIPMTAFPDMSDDEVKSILTYIGENGSAGGDVAAGGGGGTSTAGGSSSSEPSTVNSPWLWLVILITAITGFFAYRYSKKVKEQVASMGFHPSAHKVKNYPGLFLLYVLIAAGIIYVLVALLKDNAGMINDMMFVVLPYAAFALFIAGSIYRYTKKGYQVSSLSSQFIEGKQLFWGSQPFHWGILILFFGHLIAFLFPSSLTWFNGVPVRRMILEISSFAFGLSALLGLTLLMIRRLSNKKLLVVTNKMDMVVYTVLFTQIISGLGVAFFVRWGSEWFGSVLTPYLRSVFSFNPDITAVIEMPVWIQIHIISAFLIIAIIPFTRFMHFLVAPVDYLWRKYQVVIWNWNRKAIRNSKQHTFGKKTRNH